jgi:hypothetical protein
MTDVIALAQRLRADMELFNIISTSLQDDDYVNYIVIGTEMFYNFTGQGYASVDSIVVVDDFGDIIGFSRDFATIEKSYILLCAKIALAQWARANKAELVSYTTDALSVAHGDKPFKNISEMLSAFEQERRILHYKLNEAM